MVGLDIDLAPEELESQAEQLAVLSGTAFSHITLAESMWNDLYGIRMGLRFWVLVIERNATNLCLPNYGGH